MENSKLYTALSYFDKYEQNRLRKYISSPYFNQDKALIILFEEIITFQNTKSGKELTGEFLWKRIYASKKYDDVRFRKLRSDLLKLVEGFLAQQVLEENTLQQGAFLIEAIGKKKMTKLHDSTIKALDRLTKKQKYQSANYYYLKYTIQKNYHDLIENELRKEASESIEERANFLDQFYLAEKLKYYSFILAQQKFISHQYNVLFIDEIFSHIQKHNYENVPPVAIYYTVCLTILESDEEEHYFKLKSLLEKHQDIFPPDESERLFKFALNYCVGKINKGIQRFYGEYFEVYQKLLTNGMLFKDGYLTTWSYNNIVVAALKLNKVDWVNTFIQEYKTKLPEESRENAFSYNMAKLYFHQDRYDDVISLLNTVEYEEVSYYLGAKTLLIRTYYETDEIDALDSLLESFRTYIGRHDKISDQRKQNYRDFISFIRKLSRVIPGDQKAIKKIREEFDKSEGIVSTDEWLIEKIEELEKGKK
jgi:hypothetical protein